MSSAAAQATRSGSYDLEKRQSRGEQQCLTRPRAQFGGIEAGQVEQAPRLRSLAQRPDRCLQRQRFCICFRARHTLHHPRVDPGVARGKRVLVVEDNELNLKLFCDLLRAHQFDAEPVRDGREAVAARARLLIRSWW